MTAYRENLVRSYNVLLELHDQLFTQIINLEMTGDLAHISHSFQEGESYHFEIAQFRDSRDENVRLLVALYDNLEAQLNSLANINALTEEELEEVLAKDEDLDLSEDDLEED